MEGLQATGFLPLLRESLLRFLPLLLIIVAAPHFETLVATLTWHARPAGRFLQGPALPFLLLNCVIVTILARSKLEISQSRGHDQLEAELGWGKEDEQGVNLADDNVIIGEQSHDHEAPAILNKGYDHQIIYKKKGVDVFLRRSWSLDATYKSKTNHELQARVNHVNEKKLTRRARIASRRNDKVGLPPIKPLSSNPKEPHLRHRGSLVICSEAGSQNAQKPPPLNNLDTTGDEDCMKGVGRAEQGSDHHAPVPASATTQPSMEEVWAAILSANRREERMALCTQAEQRRKEPTSQQGKQPKRQPAGASTANRTQPEAATPLVLPAAVLHDTSPCAAGSGAASPLTAAHNTATNPTSTLSKACATAAEQQNEDSTDRENDQELEKLNRRAEEFITRFNCQMRLQRKPSLQRQKKPSSRRL